MLFSDHNGTLLRRQPGAQQMWLWHVQVAVCLQALSLLIGTMTLVRYSRALFRRMCFLTWHGNSLSLHDMQVWVVPFAALNADTGAPQVCPFIKSWCSS